MSLVGVTFNEPGRKRIIKIIGCLKNLIFLSQVLILDYWISIFLIFSYFKQTVFFLLIGSKFPTPASGLRLTQHSDAALYRAQFRVTMLGSLQVSLLNYAYPLSILKHTMFLKNSFSLSIM